MTEPKADRTLTVVAAGPQLTVQDLGRPGHAHLGVPRSGALDGPALRLANRLVGNDEGAAGLESLGGGVRLRTGVAMALAVTGAQVTVRVDGRAREWGQAVIVRAGSEVVLGTPERGLRCYVAVSGGLDVPVTLGSRSTDLLSGIGPDPVRDGDVLPVGEPQGHAVPVETTRWEPVRHELRMRLGPRDDWFDPESLARLAEAPYVVSSESNRIGLRLQGTALRRVREEELPSEGMVLGAVQVPPSGQPVVFLNDHPTTGGYPVVGVVLPEDLPTCAQLRPGEEVRLRVV
ncbi:MAG TPA: biotin-dependent carboxyltransferase family protein [Marmoricola sp.]|nr:biotin-dependent carboxyltransferase family protein [Marmoricola sp.]